MKMMGRRSSWYHACQLQQGSEGRNLAAHFNLFPLIDQTAEQIFGMIDDFCRCVSKGSVGIVSKAQDSSANDV